jgi:hypothetical protein
VITVSVSYSVREYLVSSLTLPDDVDLSDEDVIAAFLIEQGGRTGEDDELQIDDWEVVE